ncbi:MAG: PAS domain S-box protein [Spirochaetia bacterium]|nr:PAS domain S-box protein [Spirochaetia bacterium]
MNDFLATKWKFRIALGCLIVAALLIWGMLNLKIGLLSQGASDAEIHSLAQWTNIAMAFLTGILALAAVFIFRPLVLGLGKQYDDIRHTQERSRALVESAADGIITFDQSGIIESFNPAAEKLFACTAKEVVGMSIQRIIPGYRGILEVESEDPARIKGVGRELVGHRWDGSTFDMDLTVSELLMGERHLNMALIRDVSARQEAERSLKESEERFRLLVELSPDAIAIHTEGKIIFVNSKGAALLGAKDESEVIGRPVLDFVPIELRKTVLERILAMSSRQTNVPLLEEKFLRMDGQSIEVEVAAIPFIFRGKQAIQVVARDITRRRQADAEIRKSLKEKEVLLKEIHHRVKNNLQVITSLIDLQSDFVEDQKALEVLRECQNRVRSISLIHERLYQSRDLAQVDFPEYIRQLMAQLLRSYGVSPDRVTMKIDVTDIRLGLDIAIPCGLIIHELVSNALKHAFPGDRAGEIRVGLHADGDRNFLIVADNGVGFGPKTDYHTVSNLGLQLVDTLTSQIGGNIDFHGNAGTEFIISFRQG